MLVFRKGPGTNVFEAAFRINPREAISPERLESFLNNKAEHLQISTDLVRSLSPESLSLVEFRGAEDIEIAKKAFGFPGLGQGVEGSWKLVLSREFDMTNDSYLFEDKDGEGRLPLFEGKMFHQFDHRWSRPRYWLDEVKARAVISGPRLRSLRQASDQVDVESFNEGDLVLDYESFRIAFRDVARSTDERTLIAALLPCNVFCPHTASLESVYYDEIQAGQVKLNIERLSHQQRFFVLSMLNSFVVDYLIRQRITTHCSFFLVNALPVPRLKDESPQMHFIVERAARLTCTTEEFSVLWEKVMNSGWSVDVAASDPAERTKVRAELDGLIAHLYGLTEEEFAHILSTFPVVPQATKDATLAAYRHFAPKPGDPEIAALVAQGESHELEFKSTVRWDLREQKKSPELEKVVQKTVAGFLNSEGGTLLIGVADDGSVVGLEPDFRTLKKADRDGFELFLSDLLLNTYGRDLTPYIRVTFHPLDGKEVCRVTVSSSPRPVYLKEGNEETLYVRSGNSTRRLSIREGIEYAKERWHS